MPLERFSKKHFRKSDQTQNDTKFLYGGCYYSEFRVSYFFYNESINKIHFKLSHYFTIRCFQQKKYWRDKTVRVILSSIMFHRPTINLVIYYAWHFLPIYVPKRVFLAIFFYSKLYNQKLNLYGRLIVLIHIDYKMTMYQF